MTNANECTCPSGDGSIRHPCPAHPTVEQAGGDERVIGWRERILAAHPNSDPGFWPDALLVEHMAAEIADLRAALAQLSPASDLDPLNLAPHVEAFNEAPAEALKPEQAEAERPEVVAWRYGFSGGIVSDKACLDEWKSGGEYQSLMTVAQHERIVGALTRDHAHVEEHLSQQIDILRINLAAKRDNLDAALARVAELERGKVYVEARRCDECQHVGINDSATGVAACHECDWTGPEPEEDKCPGCQRENCMAAACPQCGARYVLVASEEIAAPVAQAQHSVPDDVETFLDEVRAELLRARSKFPGDRIMTIALAEEFGELCKAVLDEPAANVRKEAVQTAVMAARVVLDGDGSVTAWRAERGLDPLAAAPGKEGV
ncbi:hypothetical protein [Pseudomonas aeruginosa]|uniref:hypothetical protein n=1 Tax=Pseudomonas aeruginosa TaxID=287 RepID=UPI002090D4F9|nr:hypothetical protein [Pseudomonas aeruginosa]MCO5377166.1 hypothetical protein [Pseudomonas aeruginosa]